MANRKEYDKHKSLYFDFSNPNDKFLYDVLSKCRKRQNKLLSAALREFFLNFGITEEIKAEDLKNLIDNYDIIKNMKPQPVVVQTNTTIPQVTQPEKEIDAVEVVEEDEEELRMELAAALGGFNVE